MVCKVSIILPYQHLDERYGIFYAFLSNLTSLVGNRAEICIHEVGPKRHLYLPEKFKYLYTRYSGIFHRAWVLNRCVKKLSTGSMLVLMDTDLIMNEDWVNEILHCTTQSIAWNKLHLLSTKATQKYIDSKYIDHSEIKQTKSPSMGSAAGAAMIVPRKLFYDLSGIPEDFLGSWGGEDNAFWAKLTHLGHKISIFKSEIYHLDHPPSTPRVTSIQRKVIPMLQWKKVQWIEYIKLVGNIWGNLNPETYSSPDISTVTQSANIPLTLAMLSWLRYDKLINTLESLHKTLTIPINLCIMVQGDENLTTQQRREVRFLANKFEGSDVFFTKDNIGTGPARIKLIERALNKFNTPYINFADDDTTYTSGSVESAIELLNSDYSIGVVGIRYKDKGYVLDSQFKPFDLKPIELTQSIEEVDCTGSASAIIRREVFDLCKIDPFYIIGYWDLDFFLQARHIGWRIVNYQSGDSIGAINNWGGSPEYRKARTNKEKILLGRKHFKSIWMLRNTI